jgi:hypothetical protein
MSTARAKKSQAGCECVSWRWDDVPFNMRVVFLDRSAAAVSAIRDDNS